MKVICFGDSNTYGYDPRSWFGGRYDKDSRWVDILAGKTGWEVCNLGENGRSIPRTAPALPKDAGLLIVMLGTNDLLQGRSPEAAAETMRRFLLSLCLEPEKILLIAPPPMTRGAWVPDKTLIDASKALTGYYQDLAEQLGVRFADAGTWNIPLAHDGVHLTEQGHRAFAAGLFDRLIHKGDLLAIG